MTPTLRHAHRTALYQRRQLLRQTRREQQPDPVWFHGIGTLTYRGGQRPMPHPQLSLGQRVWQGTTTGVWHGVQRGRCGNGTRLGNVVYIVPESRRE